MTCALCRRPVTIDKDGNVLCKHVESAHKFKEVDWVQFGEALFGKAKVTDAPT